MESFQKELDKIWFYPEQLPGKKSIFRKNRTRSNANFREGAKLPKIKSKFNIHNNIRTQRRR